MERSMLQTHILGICVLQGFLGFVAVGYARTITVSQAGGADYTSITAAYNYMVKQTKGTLKENWTIQVLDASVYDESVVISDLGTKANTRLMVCSGGLTLPTVYPTADAARPVVVHGTNFVTISGFVFKNNQINIADAMTAINFDGHAPSDSQVTFDNCVWDGQGQIYDFKGILFCWEPHCNITVQNSAFQNVVVGENLALVYLGTRSRPMANVPTFTFRGNFVANNTDAQVQIEGNPGKRYYHRIVIQDNEFIGNVGQWDLVSIENQKAGNDIRGNTFIGNSITVKTFVLINSGSAVIAGNEFNQNDAIAEVFLQDSFASTITMTGNTLAASPGCFGAWADLSGKAVLQSSGNTFYSDSDYVAFWGAVDTGRELTISEWNAKTPSDGMDFLGP